jgi:hypothetical protein
LTVKGKVVKDGKKLDVPERDTLMIMLDSVEQGHRIQNVATYNVAEGTFVCKGLDNRGVPAGKVRIEVWPAKANVPPYNDYLFKGQFKGDKSPLETVLTEANCQDIVIDVGTRKVSPQ